MSLKEIKINFEIIKYIHFLCIDLYKVILFFYWHYITNDTLLTIYERYND